MPKYWNRYPPNQYLNNNNYKRNHQRNMYRNKRFFHQKYQYQNHHRINQLLPKHNGIYGSNQRFNPKSSDYGSKMSLNKCLVHFLMFCCDPCTNFYIVYIKVKHFIVYHSKQEITMIVCEIEQYY